MSKVLKSTATAIRYCNLYNGNILWYTGVSTVSIYNLKSLGQRNIAQWTMAPTGLGAGSIEKITLYIYRQAVSSSSNPTVYVGCSSNRSDYNSVRSAGVPVTMSSGSGWKAIDVSGLKNYIAAFASTWYLLMGDTEDEVDMFDVSGTDNMLYLEIQYSDGSKIYLASGNTLIPYKLYRAENGVLVPYDIYRGENGSLVKY